MKVVAEIGLDIVKVEEIKEKLKAIAATVDAGTPQINKNRRIKSLVGMAERLIAEMITVGYKEVENG